MQASHQGSGPVPDLEDHSCSPELELLLPLLAFGITIKSLS